MSESAFLQTADTVLEALDVQPQAGLSAQFVARRQQRYGPNSIIEGARTGIGMLLLEQLTDVMVIVLIAASVISAVLVEVGDGTIRPGA